MSAPATKLFPVCPGNGEGGCFISARIRRAVGCVCLYRGKGFCFMSGIKEGFRRGSLNDGGKGG